MAPNWKQRVLLMGEPTKSIKLAAGLLKCQAFIAEFKPSWRCITTWDEAKKPTRQIAWRIYAAWKSKFLSGALWDYFWYICLQCLDFLGFLWQMTLMQWIFSINTLSLAFNQSWKKEWCRNGFYIFCRSISLVDELIVGEPVGLNT